MSVLPLKTHIRLQNCAIQTKKGHLFPIHQAQSCRVEQIYDVYTNHQGQAAMYYERNCKSRLFSVLHNINRIYKGLNTVIECDIPYVIIGDRLVSCRLIKLCNQLHNGDTSFGPTQWRKYVYHQHLDRMRNYYDVNHLSYNTQNLHQSIESTILTKYYFEKIYRHLFWFNWYPALLKINTAIYKLGTTSLSYDVSFGTRNVYDSLKNAHKYGIHLPDQFEDQNNNSAAKPDVSPAINQGEPDHGEITDDGESDDEKVDEGEAQYEEEGQVDEELYSVLKKEFKCDFGYMSMMSDHGFILELYPTPSCSEAHKIIVKPLVKHTVRYLWECEWKLQAMQYKTDGWLQNSGIAEKIAKSILDNHDGDIFLFGNYQTYNLHEFVQCLTVEIFLDATKCDISVIFDCDFALSHRLLWIRFTWFE